MSETPTRPRLATATVEVMRDAVATEEMRAWVRRTLIATAWEAAINAGGVGMYGLTDLRIVDNPSRTASIQDRWDEEAAVDGREAATAPECVVAMVDATIVWPPDGPVRYADEATDA